MRIGILGPVELAVDGRDVPVGGRRLRVLLGALALDAPRPVPLGRLAEAVWEGDPPAGARNALQTLVSRARRMLAAAGIADPSAILVQAPAGYSLAVGPDAVDARRFATLVQSGRDAVRADQLSRGAQLLSEALSLWRGPLLADAGAAPDVLAARARWEQMRLAAWEARLRAELLLAARGSGDIAEPIAALSALTAEHPLHEGFAVLLLDGLAAAGRLPEALEAYDQIRHRLADQLGIDPPAGVQEAHLRLLRAPAALTGPATPAGPTAPAAASPGSRPVREAGADASDPRRPAPPRRGTAVRAQVSTFVGRDGDRIALADLLRGRRLVTLVGAGGAGKTRLAGEVAAAVAGDPAGAFDGVWMAELAGVGAGAGPAQVAEALLATLDLGESRMIDRRVQIERTATERLVDALRDRRDLLVLDNCEHVIDAAASLADDLLARCPALRILATSREPLSIDGEAVYPVAPLTLPDPGDAADPAALLECPSVRLFVDRATAARPAFVLDGSSAEAVVQICRRLDGLPLALELAAARLRTLSVEHIAARLSDRFALLTSGSRTAFPRHRTLHAVVAWSWDLLDDDERRLMQTLAVFAGGISPEAAASVCGGAAMVDQLASLAEKSLLTVLDGPAPRFRMLETIREFGVEQLRAEGRDGQVRAAHAAFFADLAHEQAPAILGPQQRESIAVLALERDNLFAALQALVGAGQAQRAATLVIDLSWAWMLTGAHGVASAWTKAALEADGPIEPGDWAVAQVIYGVNSMALGGHRLVTADFLRARLILAEPDPRTQPSMSLMMRIMCAIFAGEETEEAIARAGADQATVAALQREADRREALMDQALAGDDPWVRAAVQLMRGNIAENDGDIDAARRAYADALARFEDLGERWGAGNALDGLARALMVQGDLPAALAALQRSQQAMEEIGAVDDVAQSQCWMAQLRLRMGEVEEAELALADAIERFGRSGSPFAPILTTVVAAEIALSRGDVAGALRLCGVAAEQAQEAGPAAPPQLRSLALGMTAALHALPGGERDLPAARREAAEALALADASRDVPILAAVAVVVALLLLAEGDVAAGARVFGAARAARGAEDPSNPICIEVRRQLDGTPRAAAGSVRAAVESGARLSRGEAIAELRQLADRLAG